MEDVMLAMSALLIRNGQRVGSRLTNTDGQDSDGLVEQASLKSQPSDKAPASPNAQANRQIPAKTAKISQPKSQEGLGRSAAVILATSKAQRQQGGSQTHSLSTQVSGPIRCGTQPGAGKLIP